MGSDTAPRDKKLLVDVEQVRIAFQTLAEPGQVVEIRVLDALTVDSPKYVYTASGYFNDLEKLTRALKTIQRAKGIYMTLHPCQPALLARASNRLRNAQDMKSDKSTTTDTQILRYRWLPIDADPSRPSGISSSDEEHEAALAVAQNIRAELRAEGWPEPIRGDSGNGAHLLYPIDLEITPENTALVQRALQGLAARFNVPGVTIDLTVFNPARIWKLYGTLACKGDDTPDRPHRHARLIETPARELIVSLDQLRAVAIEALETQAVKNTPGPGLGPQFSVEGFLAKHRIAVLSSEKYQDGMRYRLETCPFCQEQDKSACVYDFKSGPGFSCSHNRCANLHWHDFREHFEPGYDQQHKARQTPIELNGHETKKDITPNFVLECLRMAEYGDALLFTELFRGEVIFDHTAGDWYIWQKNYWECDETGRIKHYVSGKLASVYIRAGATLNEQEKGIDTETEEGKAALQRLKKTIGGLTARAIELRHIARCKNVLNFAASEPGMGIKAAQWDTHKWMMGTPGGVIDLKTGQLRPGRPEDYIRTIAPTEWRGLNAPASRWEQCLREMFELKEMPDHTFVRRTEAELTELISFLQRLLGYGILGEVSDHIFTIFFGEGGRNGKDTILHLLSFALGEMCTAVNNDVLLATDRGHSAGAATPHISDLQGKRIAWASEPEEGSRFSVGQVKQLTGGGLIPTRGLYEKKQYKFEPSHLLILLTNHKPHADANDDAFWERLRLITFSMRFIDNPKKENERKKEPGLWDTLEKEAAGVLAWLVRGCLDWQRDGLDTPEAVIADGLQYRQNEDPILLFLTECCVVLPDLKCKASDLYKRYETWAKDGNIKPILNSTRFGLLMAKRFKKEKDGVMWYFGVALPILDSLIPDLDSSGGSESTLQNGWKKPGKPDEDSPIKQSYGQFGQFSQQSASIGDDSFQNLEVSVKTIQTVHNKEEEKALTGLVKRDGHALDGSKNYPEEYSEEI